MQKAGTENSKRNDILAVSLDLFLKNGYEKTSIRMISKEVGCEVGLVYYYFETKEDVFENALELYFSSRRNELTAISEKADGDVSRLLELLFPYLKKEAKSYRKTFTNGVHWTVHMAIRERYIEILEPLLADIYDIRAEDSRMPHAKDLTVHTLACLLVGAAFHDDYQYFDKYESDILAETKTYFALDGRSSGRKQDIPSFLL